MAGEYCVLQLRRVGNLWALNQRREAIGGTRTRERRQTYSRWIDGFLYVVKAENVLKYPLRYAKPT